MGTCLSVFMVELEEEENLDSSDRPLIFRGGAVSTSMLAVWDYPGNREWVRVPSEWLGMVINEIAFGVQDTLSTSFHPHSVGREHLRNLEFELCRPLSGDCLLGCRSTPGFVLEVAATHSVDVEPARYEVSALAAGLDYSPSDRLVACTSACLAPALGLLERRDQVAGTLMVDTGTMVKEQLAVRMKVAAVELLGTHIVARGKMEIAVALGALMGVSERRSKSSPSSPDLF